MTEINGASQKVIKFRAQKSTKDGKRGEFIVGYYYITHERPNRSEHWILEEDGTKTLVYPDTLGQFTGLLDRTGKEIYEGDILTVGDSYFEDVTGYGEGTTEDVNSIVLVKWSNHYGCFYVEVLDGADYINSKEFQSFQTIDGNVGLDDMEVIGNVFEHPDLLSKEQASKEDTIKAMLELQEEWVNSDWLESDDISFLAFIKWLRKRGAK